MDGRAGADDVMNGVQRRLSGLELDRATAAYARTKEVLAKPGEVRSDYVTRAKELPAMILHTGVGQTLAFLLSEKKEGVVLLRSALGPRVRVRAFPHWNASTDDRDLLKMLCGGSSREWRAATAEAIAYATWLKRFAEALVEPTIERISPATEVPPDGNASTV